MSLMFSKTQVTESVFKVELFHPIQGTCLEFVEGGLIFVILRSVKC